MDYIDFDGVILDTEELLFENWRKIENRHDLPETEKIKYIQQQNWEYILNNSPIINDSIYYLKQMNAKTSAILTKVQSYKNEGLSKIKYLREQGIKQDIILVPGYIKKTEIVDAYGCTLTDDSLKNLGEWQAAGGIPIFFDKDDDNIDSWHQYNDKGYPRVKRLGKK